QPDDPHRRLVQHRDVAGLDDAGALHAAVAAHAHADHHQPADPAPARLVRVVEVADPLDPVDPAAQVFGPGVFLRAGRNELALRALGVLLRAQLDLGGQPRHLDVALDLL